MFPDNEKPETTAPSTPEQERLLKELREMRERWAQLPILDDRSDDEIIGYDEHGIPN
jgi:hypothetical protein